MVTVVTGDDEDVMMVHNHHHGDDSDEDAKLLPAMKKLMTVVKKTKKHTTGDVGGLVAFWSMGRSGNYTLKQKFEILTVLKHPCLKLSI